MVPRIQPVRLLRLAHRQIPRPNTLVCSPTTAPQCRRLQPFSTSLARRQQPRQPPVSPDSEPPAATPPAASDPVSSATSTPSPPPPSTPSSSPSPSPSQNAPAKPKPRLAPRLLLAVAFTLLGATLGSSARLLLSPPTPPAPGTDEDAYTTRVLHDQAAKLPVVQQLSSDPAWAESWDAYESLSAEQRAQHITAGALAGSRGVGGYQRVWWNKTARELVSVIYFGAATTGWPGVVHGGCLATILDESCGRAAFKEWGGKPGFTASLVLKYRKVTMANGFYVVRVRARPEEMLPENERGKRHYKCWVDGTIEDPVSGAVTVAAEALFVGGQGKKNGKGDEGRWDGEAQEAHLRF